MSGSTRSSDTMRNDQTADLSNEKHAFVSQYANGSVFPYAIGANKERHSILSPEVKKERKTLGLHFVKTLLILTILMWACLSIFWGSTYKLLVYFSNLTINVYDFDSTGSSSAGVTPIVGPVFTSYASYSNSLPSSMPHLGYRVIDVTQSPYSDMGTQAAIDDVLRKKCWGAIVIHANATTSWRNAVQAGDAGYDPQGSVGVYYMGARYYQIVLLYLRPFLIRDTSTNIQTASQTALSSILTSLSATYTAPSQYPPTQPPITTTLAALETVPQGLSGPFGYYTYDLRPQTAWGAAAVFEAGDIYYLIFAFHLALWHYLGRTSSGLQKKLTYKSLMLLRIMVPLFIYFWMSLWYTCIIAAFQVPFNNTVGHAGFVVDWALNWVALAALGFAFETMMSVLGPKVLPLFLIVWIILNITSSFQPLTVMGRFYKFFLIFPFYHHVEASKIIFFNTSPSSFLGTHFAALFGAIGVNWICLALAVWFERKKDDKAAKEEQEKKQDDEKNQEEEQ